MEKRERGRRKAQRGKGGRVKGVLLFVSSLPCPLISSPLHTRQRSLSDGSTRLSINHAHPPFDSPTETLINDPPGRRAD